MARCAVLVPSPYAYQKARWLVPADIGEPHGLADEPIRRGTVSLVVGRHGLGFHVGAEVRAKLIA